MSGCEIYEEYEVIGQCEIGERDGCDSYSEKKCKKCKHFIPTKTDYFELREKK